PLHKIAHERLFVRFKGLLPWPLSHNYSLTDRARIDDEFLQRQRHWQPGHISVSGSVCAFDQESGFLKLDREEKGRRYIHSHGLNATLIVAAGSNLIGPEGETRSIRFAI